mgnify:FL=1
MAITRLGGANAISGTIPQGNIANASLGAVTALPAAIPTGKILQAVTDVTSGSSATTSTSYVDVGTSVSITPSAATSKILVLVTFAIEIAGSSQSQAVYLNVLRDSTSLYDNYAIRTYDQGGSGVQALPIDGMSILDSPSSSSSLTYKLQYRRENGSEARHKYSSITLLEVGA